MAKSSKKTGFVPTCNVYEDDDDGENCWYAEYEVVPGKGQNVLLEADNYDDAKTEAAGITGIPVDKITHG